MSRIGNRQDGLGELSESPITHGRVAHEWKLEPSRPDRGREKKAVVERGDIRPLHNVCGNIPHHTATIDCIDDGH